MELPVTIQEHNSTEAEIVGKLFLREEKLKELFEECVEGADYTISFTYVKQTVDEMGMPGIESIKEVSLVRTDV